MTYSPEATARTPAQAWPSLSSREAWPDTRATLHMWTQIVGKIRLALSPPQNHYWHSALYVSTHGLTTSPMPYGSELVQIDFDFLKHRLLIDTSWDASAEVRLEPRSVADFYADVMAAVHRLGIDVSIWATPVEVPDPVPFEQDTVHDSYDPAAVQDNTGVFGTGQDVAEIDVGHEHEIGGVARLDARPRQTEDRAGARRDGVQGLLGGEVACGLSGKVQPGALLLGRVRPGRDAVLRSPCTDVEWTHTQRQPARDARVVLARGEQRRILAGHRQRAAGVLQLRGSRAARLSRGPGRTRRRRLWPGDGRVHAAV